MEMENYLKGIYITVLQKAADVGLFLLKQALSR